MDRRIAMVGVVSAAFVASCAPAVSVGPSGTEAEASHTAPPSATPAASPNPFGGWTPSSVAVLGAPSAVVLGDYVPERLEAVASRFLLFGQDGQGRSLLVEGTADGRAWTRLDTAPLGQWIGDVAAGPRGAILSIDDPTSGQLVSLWYSADGLTWGQVDVPSDLGAATGEHLVAGPGGFAITAELGASGSESGSDIPAVWTSTNGHDWGDVTDLRGVDVASVAPLAGAFVASGAGDPPVLEISTDGQTFRSDPGAATSPLTGQVLLEQAVGSNLVVVDRPDAGLRVSIGSVGDSGLTWTTLPADAFAGREAIAAASRGSGIELLGYDGSAYTPVGWSSADGRSFVETDLGATTFGGGVSRLVAASGDGLAALGWQADPSGRVVRAMWTSVDGATWSPAPTDLFGAIGPVPSAVACPASPTTADALMRLDPIEWPACYGRKEIEISGYANDCGGCGGTTPYVGTPSWLIDPLGFRAFWLAPSVVQTATGGLGIGVQIDPRHPVAVPPVGSHVRLVGHFDDAAAQTCRVVPSVGSGAELMPPVIAVTQCREDFVLTGVTFLR